MPHSSMRWICSFGSDEQNDMHECRYEISEETHMKSNKQSVEAVATVAVHKGLQSTIHQLLSG